VVGVTRLGALDLSGPESAVGARHKARKVAGLLGLSPVVAAHLACEVSVFCRQTRLHSGARRVQVRLAQCPAGAALRFAVEMPDDETRVDGHDLSAISLGTFRSDPAPSLEFALPRGGLDAAVLEGAARVLEHLTEAELLEQLHARNEALQRATEVAERAAEAKANFLATMTHEIRTPMNAVLGFSDLAERTELSPRQKGYIEKIRSSSRHLLGLVDDVLDFSKIEAGKMTVERVEFGVDSLLETVQNLVGTRCLSKGLELVLDVAPDVPQCLVGDPTRLGQILVNYAGNAVKFTERGEIVVALRVAEADDDGILLHCSVTDTGIGLTQEQRAKLFRSFQQADSSTTRQFGGTGLGLAISRQLAELMGGTVGVESEIGQGSSFWCTARVGIAAESAQPAALARPVRALIVDDSRGARVALRNHLQRLGVDVTKAPSSDDAVAHLVRVDATGEPFDVVFVDEDMPDVSGAETVRRIRALGLGRTPRLVMLVNREAGEAAEAGVDADVDGWIAKPLSASAVFDVLAQVTADEGGELAADGVRQRADRHGTGAAARARLRGTRVLLVEDNEVNQQVATELLEYFGVVVTVAGDGREAVEQVARGGFDVVLMDMQMPVMDGLDATRAIRAMPGFESLPIVAMTANAMQSDRERCLAAGMNDHVAKPIDPAMLSAALERWAPESRSAESVAPDAAPAAAYRDRASDVRLPYDVPGLDVAGALQRMQGKAGFYMRMLQTFAMTRGRTAADLREAIEAGDWERAVRAAHSLKGVAATIGAVDVAAAASEAQDLCERAVADAALYDQVAVIGERLDELLAALAPWLRAGPEG
jgi:two-component system sensor histidine kinase/response regulator